MSVHIEEVEAEVDARPKPAGAWLGKFGLAPGQDGVDRDVLEKLRPFVLRILREELERLSRQQG